MPDFICLGGLRIDYLITAEGRAVSDIFGGNATFAAVGARLWSQPGQVGILAKNGPNFPADWLAQLESHGIDTRCVIPIDEPVDQRTFFSHFADGSRDEGNPHSHYRALGLPLPDGLRGYNQPSADAQEASYRPLRIDGAEVAGNCWPRRAFHCSPIDWETTRSCLTAARRTGTPQITLDPGLWIGHHPSAEISEVLQLCDAFLPSEAGQATAVFYWRIVPLTIAGYGITIAASAGFNGLGRPGHGMAITAGRALGLMVPGVLIGAIWLDAPQGVIWGVAFANVVSGTLAGLYILTRAPMTAKHGKARKSAVAPVAEETL